MRSALQQHGVRTFADWNDLGAGLPWPSRLERALQEANAVAVFIGASGFGRWQTREMYYALDLQAQRAEGAYPVIPVLLPGSEPPSGFLALNTWVDLRNGVEDASLAPLLSAIGGAVHVDAPARDVCPYRDLRAFREEDAPLFFGRDEAKEKLLRHVDASSRTQSRPALIALVGKSGSGKSSVIAAGLLPLLRRQRPPSVVWDAVSFTPGDAPWRRLADALLPLLAANLSEARRLNEAADLAKALRHENGVVSVIARVLEKSRGTDRLLVVIDQAEEFFTLTPEPVAREFVKALLAASRSVQITILLTLRSDYYGRAVSFDRDLSDLLPEAQVNLGPIRADELRAVIEKPAKVVGVTFELELVNRILDDVGHEPGNLPLLEYALTELWKSRSGDRLTFESYDRIGRATGALARRANVLYDELSAPQKVAAQRLMLRLVRVAAANEEGADTRRRARRDELDDEAWALVPFFSGPRARLLVAGRDPETGQDTVEVAHEALIREWDRLREWVEEDRRFLLWCQQLALYREAWSAGDHNDEGTLLRGTLLRDAQQWLRERRAELNDAERQYIERSGARVAYSRFVIRAAAAVVLLALIATAIYFVDLRSASGTVRRILAQKPEFHAHTSEDVATLYLLGWERQLEKKISNADDLWPWRGELAVAAHETGHKDFANELFAAAVARARSRNPAGLLVVAQYYVRIGRRPDALTLVREAETHGVFKEDPTELAISLADAGDLPRARALVHQLLNSIPQNAWDERSRTVARCAALLLSHDGSEFRQQIAERLRAVPPQGPITPPDTVALVAKALARYEVLIVDELLSRKDFDAADEILASASSREPDLELRLLEGYLRAERLDRAERVIRRVQMDNLPYRLLVLIYAKRSTAHGRAGRKREAVEAYAHARVMAADGYPVNEVIRDAMRKDLVESLVARGDYYEARKLADTIENYHENWKAYFVILREYVRSQRGARTTRPPSSRTP